MPSKKQRIAIYLTDDEHEHIAALARQTGLSMSTFARRVCLGQTVTSVMDYRAVLDLLRVNADLGRLGGLLKMWLSNKDWRQAKVNTLLQELQAASKQLQAKVKELGR